MVNKYRSSFIKQNTSKWEEKDTTTRSIRKTSYYSERSRELFEPWIFGCRKRLCGTKICIIYKEKEESKEEVNSRTKRVQQNPF